MGDSLQKRIHQLVKQEFAKGPGAWLVWCDPTGAWWPLLKRVAEDNRMGGFPLHPVETTTAGAMGGPLVRRQVQERIASQTSFVLYVRAAADQLGWLWAQALLAETIYQQTLRNQLLAWGWRPQNYTAGDEEIAALALSKLQQDPSEWGSGGLQPDLDLLLEVLAGYLTPSKQNDFVLDMTIEQAGLPALDQEDVATWRKRVLARLLVTEVQQVAPHLLAESHELVIRPASRPLALQLLRRWADSHRLMENLANAVIEADRIAGLGALLDAATLEDGPFLSQAAERAVFAAVCTRLAQLSGKTLLEEMAGLGQGLQRHATGFWSRQASATPQQMIPWGELQRLSRAAQDLVEAMPQAEWSSPATAIGWYANGGWRIDRAGEEITRSLERSTPELVALIAPLRAAYRARWESLLIEWSQVWENAGCPQPATPQGPLPSAGAWLKTQLAANPRPTAILVVDALRYDLGSSLAARLNHQESVERATVMPAHAPLPSITALGMGMALPVTEEQCQAELVDKKWQLRLMDSTDNLSVASQRRAWWQAQIKGVQLLELSDIKAGAIPEPSSKSKRLVIHDAAIDILGHDDELEFQGSEPIMKRYLEAIERLRDKGWLRILLVTDHGYIHWPSSEEKNAPYPAPDPTYAARRALAYPATTALTGPQALAPGGKWRVALPRGAASFRAYGGLGYFHGGASLQEWIIPCVAIEWPLTARPVSVQLQLLDKILTLRPKVVLQVAADSLLREENIPRQIQVIVRLAEERTILFRSSDQLVTAEDSPLELALNVEEDVTATRGAALRIEVRDARTEEILDTIDSTLLIEITGW